MGQENKVEDIELIKPKISEDHQILAALASTGAGFEALGGSSLMLCEAVENGVDSIIEARRENPKLVGKIEVIIDKKEEAVIIIDNGLGFKNPRHICEKPFDSLKKYDPELTGKFARGIQGFRSYCNNLIFVTRRRKIPDGESFSGKRGDTLQLEFSSDRIEVGCGVAPDSKFHEWINSDQGAVAFYTDWKKGEFQKIRKEYLIKRIEHHFGVLIRKGQIEILVWEGSEKLFHNQRLDVSKSYRCVPRDYSSMKKIDIKPIPYIINGNKIGEIIFELYLTERVKRDRMLLPFLMYNDRPVGDKSIFEIEEFGESDVWYSNYLTGFVRCDFCKINELRLALKPSPEREFLYEELVEIESLLRNEIKSHHKGLIEIKIQREINELVSKLQNFLKSKNIFDFKLAKDIGSLSTGEKPDKIAVSNGSGHDLGTSFITDSGNETVEFVDKTVAVIKNGRISTDPKGENFVKVSGREGKGGNGGNNGNGFVTKGKVDEIRGSEGHSPNNKGSEKSLIETVKATDGDQTKKTKKHSWRRRPRGFNISFESNEFDDVLSWFDSVNSTVIINTANERYRKRDDPSSPTNKEMMAYWAELYIWEICRLSKELKEKKENTQIDVNDLFLKTKFEFFETHKET